MSQLAGQGVLDQIPGLGAIIKAPSPREMEDLYEFCEALESHAAFMTASRINSNQLTRLQATLAETRAVLAGMFDTDTYELDKASAHRWVQLDARRHAVVLKASGSRWLQRHGTGNQFLRRIWRQWLEPEHFDIRAVLLNSYRDHTRIPCTLYKARREMFSHIQATKKRFAYLSHALIPRHE